MRTLASRIIGDRGRSGALRQLLVSGAAATTVILMSSSATPAALGGRASASASTSFDAGTADLSRPIHVPAISVRQARVPHGKGTPQLPPSAFGRLDIPPTALAAYQRAAVVIGQADGSCGLSWPLLAAIGRVESDHGRYGGAVLRPDGTSSPAIRGVALDGTGPVARIPDTDGGRLDGDPVWDRAVGPMQLLPSTWSVVGVDANGDSVRSPDDIDDAALAAAVFLCGAPGDLTTRSGQSIAVHRYNPSAAYVSSVLALEQLYRSNQPDLLGRLVLGHAVEIAAPAAPLSAPLSAPTGPRRPGRGGDGGAAVGGSSTPALAHGAAGQQPASGGSGRPGQDPAAPPSAAAGPGAAADSPAADPAGSSGDGAAGTGTGTPGAGGTGAPGTGGAAGPGGTDGAGAPAPGPTGTPAPSPTPTPTPAPTPTPSPSPTPPPPPPPPPAPDPVRLTGVLTACGTTWCLGQTPLDVGAPAVLAGPARADFDADGAVESNQDELSGLAGTTVSVQAEAGTSPARVLTINELAYVEG